MSYADLEIHIQRKGDKGRAGYPVDITFMGEVEFPTGELDARLPVLSTLSSGVDPQKDGEALFNWFFNDSRLTSAWAEARGKSPGRRVRLRIDDGAAELQRIPWELLRDPDSGGVALDLAATDSTPFSRYIAGKWTPGAPILQRPIKVLVAIANPKDLEDVGLSAIDTDAEFTALQDAVRGNGAVELIRLQGPCTLVAIEQALRKGVHVLHFIGHGKFVAGQTFLYLCNESDEADATDDQAVAGMIRRLLDSQGVDADDKLRMVYLSSCQTATVAPAEADAEEDDGLASSDRFGFRGLAPLLIGAGAPAVLAMQDFVQMDTARVFSQAFYAELMERGDVDRAANVARGRVINSKLPGAAIPVLYMRLRSGQLLGVRGTLSIDNADNADANFWEPLLLQIADGKCTPILGSGVTANFLPRPDEISRRLAGKFNYPFSDPENLARVAQFMEVAGGSAGRHNRNHPRDQIRPILVDYFRNSMGLSSEEYNAKVQAFQQTAAPRPPKGSLSEAADAVAWGEQSLGLFENEIHHQLADLDLPLYLTTNIDSFMTLALKAKQRRVRREVVPWYPIQSSMDRPDFDPHFSTEDPMVLHLFGADTAPVSMVLTDDDHLDYLCKASRDESHFLSSSTKAQLAESQLLFLGYRMQDLDLKIILRALYPPTGNLPPPNMRVGVQIDSDQPDKGLEDRVIKYFENYFAKDNIRIYWGSTFQFMSDLSARWRLYGRA